MYNLRIDTDTLPAHHAIAEGLAEKGFALCDAFLDAAESVALLNRLLALQARGELARAGVGREGQYRTDTAVRGDLIRWIDEERHPATDVFTGRLEALMAVLNRECFLGLVDFESHFTTYPAGTHYSRHLDQFNGSDQRRISFILYLNFGWQPADGGQLRLFLPEDDGERILDVEPLAGRLACFRSDLIEHEVLPTHKPRHSLTGWMLNRRKGLDFL